MPRPSPRSRVLAWLAGCSMLVAAAGCSTYQPQPLYDEVPAVAPAEQARWLAAGTVPMVPELGDSTLMADALRDLHVLSTGNGVPVAGWAPAWRYVWPRDSALAAAALARTGHGADAERILDFLARVQPPSGIFQARYRSDGSGPPDGRGEQLDGTGWALWAMAQIGQSLPEAERASFVNRHRGLLDRSVGAVLAQIDTPSNLPAASADYWELGEWRLTLATAAMMHAGLSSAAQLSIWTGDDAAADRARSAAARLRAAIRAAFGPDYPRTQGGGPRTVDLGVDFLLPPFAEQADADVVRAWRGAPAAMGRPAGGLAPGGSWRADGVSWTTATSSYALTAAALGDRAEAVRWLHWLDSHRTAQGSLPEKVTAAGEPSAVAPLAWTAAAVLLTGARLQS